MSIIEWAKQNAEVTVGEVREQLHGLDPDGSKFKLMMAGYRLALLQLMDGTTTRGSRACQMSVAEVKAFVAALEAEEVRVTS